MGIPVETPADLGPAAILAVADGAEIELSPRLMRRLAASRGDTVLALAENGPVYGVTTGLGSQAHLAVAAVDQPAFQDDLMLARSVGTGPWLGRREVRATLAARLRTLLEPEVGASGDSRRLSSRCCAPTYTRPFPRAGTAARARSSRWPISAPS